MPIHYRVTVHHEKMTPRALANAAAFIADLSDGFQPGEVTVETMPEAYPVDLHVHLVGDESVAQARASADGDRIVLTESNARSEAAAAQEPAKVCREPEPVVSEEPADEPVDNTPVEVEPVVTAKACRENPFAAAIQKRDEAISAQTSQNPAEEIPSMDTNAGIILDFIKRNPGCMSKDVVDATGIEMKDVSNELTRLEKKRLVLVERRSFDTGAVRRVFTVAPGV